MNAATEVKKNGLEYVPASLGHAQKTAVGINEHLRGQKSPTAVQRFLQF